MSPERSAVCVGLLLAAAISGCDLASARDEASGSPITVLSVDAPKIDFPLPQFELVDHQRRPFTSEQMKGEVWVTDFIFTTCPSVCPALTKTMARVAHDLEGQKGVKFLTITVDPETDTPEKLASFAALHGSPDPRWFFVTGDPQVVQETVLKGFLMVLRRGASPTDISHAERFVIVDKKGHVRGLYETDDAGLTALKKRVSELSAE